MSIHDTKQKRSRNVIVLIAFCIAVVIAGILIIGTQS